MQVTWGIGVTPYEVQLSYCSKVAKSKTSQLVALLSK